MCRLSVEGKVTFCRMIDFQIRKNKKINKHLSYHFPDFACQLKADWFFCILTRFCYFVIFILARLIMGAQQHLLVSFSCICWVAKDAECLSVSCFLL